MHARRGERESRVTRDRLTRVPSTTRVDVLVYYIEETSAFPSRKASARPRRRFVAHNGGHGRGLGRHGGLGGP